MESIVFIVLFILSIPIALFVILKPVINDRKVRNNVKNSDPLAQHYCFELKCNPQEAIRQLSIRNVMDEPQYTFDINSLVITFSHLNASIAHQLYFYTIENRTYLKVSRMNFLVERSNIHFMINRFFINKIDAVPVDYNYFEYVVRSANR